MPVDYAPASGPELGLLTSSRLIVPQWLRDLHLRDDMSALKPLQLAVRPPQDRLDFQLGPELAPK